MFYFFILQYFGGQEPENRFKHLPARRLAARVCLKLCLQYSHRSRNKAGQVVPEFFLNRRHQSGIDERKLLGGGQINARLGLINRRGGEVFSVLAKKTFQLIEADSFEVLREAGCLLVPFNAVFAAAQHHRGSHCPQ